MLEFKRHGYNEQDLHALYCSINKALYSLECNEKCDCKNCKNYLPCYDLSNLMDYIKNCLKNF